MKTALVTGAYKGLGLEWCRQLSLDGYRVFLSARRLDKAEMAAESLAREGLDSVPLALDVGDEDDMAAVAAQLAAQIGHLDLLVNNAGINSKDDPDPAVVAKSTHLADLDADEILRHVAINALSPILMVKHFRALLRAAERPVVVSISSWLGSIGEKTTARGHYAYTTSKAALNMMNRNLAIELNADGIIALVVNPGWVKTDMGGDQADLTATQSVRGLIDNVIVPARPGDSGGFYQWDGTQHPW